MTTDDPNPYGKCVSCRHWERSDLLSRQHHDWGCCELDLGSMNPWMRDDDTCPDYHRRETHAERDAAIVQSLRDTSERYRRNGGPASDAGRP